MLPFLSTLRTFTVHQLARSLLCQFLVFLWNFVVTARGGFTRFYFLSAARSLVWGCVALSVVAVGRWSLGVAPQGLACPCCVGVPLLGSRWDRMWTPVAILGSSVDIRNQFSRAFSDFQTVWQGL